MSKRRATTRNMDSLAQTIFSVTVGHERCFGGRRILKDEADWYLTLWGAARLA